MRERLKPIEIWEMQTIRGFVVKKVDQNGNPVGEPLLVVDRYLSGRSGSLDPVKYLNVVTLITESGTLGYKSDPQRILKGEKIVVVGNLDASNLGWDFMQRFYKPLNDDDLLPRGKQIYHLPDLSEAELARLQ